MLLLTLAAGKGRAEGGLMCVPPMRVTVIMGIKKSRLRCRFQRDGPLHIVILGPDNAYLVK